MMMHHAMNQLCKVCGEPAAGFHFGAFTCEGCKSFFGRTYNNLSSLSECKNNGRCVINKKNRTSCKSCRLRKCLMVGMSKSGSRYGRRSNWFKIHCLLQDQANLSNAHQLEQTTLNGLAGALTGSGDGSKMGYEVDERARGDSSSSESGAGLRMSDDTGLGVHRATSSPDSHDDDDNSKLSSSGGSSAPPTLMLARAFYGGESAAPPPMLKNGLGGALTNPFSSSPYDSPSPPNSGERKDPASAAAAAAAAAFLLGPPHHLPMSPISPLSPLQQPTKFLFNPGYLHHAQQHHLHHQHHAAMLNGLNGFAAKLHPAYRPFLQPSTFDLFSPTTHSTGGVSVAADHKHSSSHKRSPGVDLVGCCPAPEQESPIDLSVKTGCRTSSPGTSLDDDMGSPLSTGDGSGEDGDGRGSAMDDDGEDLSAPASPLDLTKSRISVNSPLERDERHKESQQSSIQGMEQEKKDQDRPRSSPILSAVQQ